MNDEFVVTAYDSEGKVVICDLCDKPAGFQIYSLTHIVKFCHEHSPLKDTPPATFHYVPDGDSLQSEGKVNNVRFFINKYDN